MKFLKSFILLCMCLCSMAHARPPAESTLELFGGEAKVLPVSVNRIVVGNGKVISVSSIAPSQLLILAESAGTSTLQLWLKDGSEQRMKVVVMEADMKRTLQDVERLLSSVDNVTARIAGSKIVLEGEMVSDTNQERAQAIQKMYPEQIVNFVGKVGWEKMVYLDVKVLELTSKGSTDLGVRWDSQINGPHAGVVADIASNSTFRYLPSAASSGLDFSDAVLPSRVWPPKGFINLSSLITSKINLLVQDGEAEVLAAPSLTTRSGSKARFVAGGEIPLPVQGGLGQTSVEFKEYGVILEVTPVTDKSGAIYAKLDVEVSSIDSSVAVLGIPGILKRRTQSEFNARDGETVVLSGLYSYEKSNDTQKVPGLGSLPLIGGAFRNKAGAKTTRELAIIITPRIAQATPNAQDAPKDINAERLYEIERKMRDKNVSPKQLQPLTVTE